ncbi:MAG: VTT domain-containing protein [Chlamydiae bacterium]|nr:VTT domain-containing protein [Chlamydiota bacterium]
MRKKIFRFAPLIIIVSLMLIFYLFNIHHLFSLETIKKEHLALKQFAQDYFAFSSFIFVVTYVVSVCLIIPDSTILTLIGGLIFPLPLAILFTAVGETIGAYLFFLAIQTALGKELMKREKTFLTTLRKNFLANAPNYLLFLRFSHLLPFWMTNLAAAYFSISSWTFLWTTFIGVLPLTYFLSETGHQLSKIFAAGEAITWKTILTPQIKIGLFLIGLCALIPILIKIWKKRKTGKS